MVVGPNGLPRLNIFHAKNRLRHRIAGVPQTKGAFDMRLAQWTMACVGVLFFTCAAYGQSDLKASPPAAPPPAKQPDAGSNGLINDLNLESPTLEDVLSALHRADPNFQAVVAREPGVAPDGPTLPALRLKNVTSDQVLRLLSNIRPISYEQIEGQGSPICLVRVQNPAREQGAGEAPMETRVYRLTEAMAGLNATDKPGTPADREAALNQVLSLIKATLAQVEDGSGVSPVVQVHAETRTLIVKGTADQLHAVEEALAAINPNRDVVARQKQLEDRDQQSKREALRIAQMEEQGASNNVEVRQLRDKLNSVEAQLGEMQKVAAEREAEIARLKAMAGQSGKGASQGGAKE
jgi:hypothetical protein